MRCALLLALVACASDPVPEGGVVIALDIPNATLDPKGYTSVEVTVHGSDGDLVRSASLGAGNTFDLGDLDPQDALAIEATLRNDSGAAVGYGRTATPATLAAGTTITIPVRRPIAYIAGLNYNADSDPNTADEDWFGTPATFSDLSVGTNLDGTTTVGTRPVLVVSAGPALFGIAQEPEDPAGTLAGPATIRPISTGDHGEAAPLPTPLTGAVQDGAGNDNGSTLVVGTAEKLYVVDAATGVTSEVADGNFARVAVVSGSVSAVAIDNRTPTTGACQSTARLWVVTAEGGDGPSAQMVATGGFTDVAADGGRAFYVDGCKNELGEITASGTRVLRANLTTLGRPTALAVSNGQAWIGVEQEGVRQTAGSAGTPAVVSLLVASIDSSDPPRVVFTEQAQQVLRAVNFPGVQRRIDAFAAAIQHLEVGAGGDYVAVTISARHYGVDYDEANFPEMTVDTEELRVFAAASGGLVQRYRSWCDGLIVRDPLDIVPWACTTSPGQTEPREFAREHTITSMTFLFGKK